MRVHTLGTGRSRGVAHMADRRVGAFRIASRARDSVAARGLSLRRGIFALWGVGVVRASKGREDTRR